MADTSILIDSLIRDIKRQDPRLAQALDLLNSQLRDVYLELNPLVLKSTIEHEIAAGVSASTSFTYQFTDKTIRLFWNEVAGAASYELRKGEDWDTASFQFRTVSLQADIDPLPIGTHTFLLKPINSAGIESPTFSSLTFSIPVIPEPTISAQVIDNNVLLSWNEPPSTFLVDYYEVTRNGESLGYIDSTFFVRFEQFSGTFTYGVKTFDIAGNEGAEGKVIATVNQPPDFQFFDLESIDFNSTIVNAQKRHTDIYYLFAPIDIVTSWHNHYANHGWNTINDKLAAGYTLYGQPVPLTGSFEHIIDFGIVVNNVIASLIYNKFLYTNFDVNVVVKMKTSLDNITYSAYTTGSTQFFAALRYITVRVEFTAVNDKALMKFSGSELRLDVKRDHDGGIVTAPSTDVGGTQVLFNKHFKDIDSIDVSGMGTTYSIVVVDFVDAPNPTGFKVYVYDGAGVRISRDVRWIARGIV